MLAWKDPLECIRPPGKGTRRDVGSSSTGRAASCSVNDVEDTRSKLSKTKLSMVEVKNDGKQERSNRKLSASNPLSLHSNVFQDAAPISPSPHQSKWSKVGDDAGPDVIVGAEIDSKPLGCHHCVRQINGRKPGFLTDRPRATQMNWLLSFLEGA